MDKRLWTIKRSRHIALLSLAGIGILLLSCVLLLQVPQVQTALVKAYVEKLNESIDGRITVGTVNILPFNTLIIKDVTLHDDAPVRTCATQSADTLLHVGSLIASFDRKGISSKPIRIKKISLEDVQAWLVKEELSSNFTRVLHIKKGGGIRDIGDVIHLGSLNARNLRFVMRNVAVRDTLPQGVDFHDLDLDIPLLKGSSVAYKDGHIVFDVDQCNLSDHSGYQIAQLSGKGDISNLNYSVSDLVLQDNWSSLKLPVLSMNWTKLPMKEDFLNDKNIDLIIKDSRLDAQSICFLLGKAGALSPVLDIQNADIHGPLANLEIKSLRASEQSGASASLTGRLRNITTPRTASADIKIQELNTTTAALQKILRKCAVSGVSGLDNFAPGKSINIKGSCKGPLNALGVDALLEGPSIGRMACDLTLRGLASPKSPLRIEGGLSSTELDLGAILGNEVLRECTMRASLRADLKPGHPTATLDSLFVDRLTLLGYDYSNLAATGKFDGSAFDGRVICSDPNLNFLFQGLFNLSGRTNNALYKFYLNLGYADLHALGIDGRDVSRVSGTVNANYIRIRSGEILGDVGLSRVMLESADGRHDLGPVTLSSSYADNTHRISLKSDFLKGSFVSDNNPLETLDIIKGASIGRFLPALCKPEDKGKSGTLDIELGFADMQKLLSFFKPGAYIADGSTFELHVNPEGRLSSLLKAQRIAIKDKYIKDLNLDLHSGTSLMEMALGSSEISLGGPVKLLSGTLKASAADDHLDTRFNFRNDSSNFGEILLGADILRRSDDVVSLQAYTLPGFITGSGQRWDLDPGTISFDGSDLSVEGIRLHSGAQSLSAEGHLLKTLEDRLAVALEDIDMSILGSLTGLSLGGKLSGNAFVISPYADKLRIEADLHSDGTMISGADAGVIKLNGLWDQALQSLTFKLQGTTGDMNTINGDGVLQTGDGILDATLGLDKFNLAYLSELIPGISGIGGSLSGEILAEGPLKAISLRGNDTRLEDARLTVDGTGVTYLINGPVEILDNAVNLDGIVFSDGHNGQGTINGGITHNHLKDFKASLKLGFTNMLVYDVDDTASQLYGRLALNGNGSVTGPMDDLVIRAGVRNAGEGNVHVLLKSGKVSSTDLLTFKQPEVWEDPYERMLRGLRTRRTKDNNIEILVHAEPDQEVEINLDLDRSNGNALTARGAGAVDVAYNPRKNDMNVTGDYSISGGNVHFSALGIATRDFSIKEGSSIKFNGDIQESDLDIDASYITKTSLANLISDTTSVSTRRTVECGINISDKLRNPQLKFSIDIPDLDPTMASSVRGALNTEDKLQRQFLSLLVTNSFLPTDQSGIVNNSSMLYSNVSEIMAGQLNNILQRLDIPLDLGLKYQPGEDGTDLFDVAVSTQLFNNRVTVNGNIGSRQDGMTQTAGDVAGDLDIGIKLDKAGAVQLNLFSHSADIYSNYLDNLQRNGVGIGYQKEFRTFRQLLHDLFHGKRKRSAEELSSAPEDEEAKVIIKIDEQD